MKLNELKKMIAEEYSRYLEEQEDVKVDVTPGVDVEPKMGGDENPEATLKTIYDMLKDYFEGDDAENDEEDDPMDEKMHGEGHGEMHDEDKDMDESADLEEFYPAQKATTTKSGEYGAKDYKKATTTRGRTGFGDKGGSLNEVKRMQKLANIIK
tara:strand:+ start:118 stop:579 length:462 start_codon:yes stop_codon:yes gene_type:complete